jgi:hypothetical protein
MRWTLGIFAPLYWLTYNIWWNRNGFDPAIGLPLHICDLSGVIAPLALLTLTIVGCAQRFIFGPLRSPVRPSSSPRWQPVRLCRCSGGSGPSTRLFWATRSSM